MPRDVVVDVSFSEHVLESSETDATNFLVENIDDAKAPVVVDGAIVYDGETFKASFTPSGLLDYCRRRRGHPSG